MLGGSTEHHRTPSSSTGPFRIFAVAGYQNRTNDIVYCPPIIRQYAKNDEDSTAIVYFGGDVQDFPESMETNRDSRGYMKYNLENSAILLREAFPSSHIIVVRPVRMEFKTFSCFDNFVRGNNAGVPDHTPMNHALQHLECLLQNLSQRLISIPEHEILNQSAQAAAAAATTSTTAIPTNTTIATTSIGGSPTKTHYAFTSSNTTSTSSPSSSISPASVSAMVINNEGSPEMDIDIMHVNDHINVVDGDDGAVIIKHADDNSQAYMNCNNGNKLMIGTTTAVITSATTNTTTAITTVAVTPPVVTTTSTSTTTIATTTTNLNNVIITNASQNKNNAQYTNNVASNATNSSTMTLQQQQQQQNNSHGEYNPLWWRENLNLDKSKLALIGFSKGCVVLNQFIYEFHYMKTLTPDDSSMIRLLSRFTDMYWLDGGHGGQKNTWITSRSLLETLTRMGMNIHVHLTPYQVQDDRRPWIRKEEKIFTDLLKRLGAPITRFLHYDSQTASLMTHFEVLQAFCQHVHAQNSSLINQQQQQKHRQQQLQQQQPAHQTQQQQQQQQGTQAHHSPINIINVLTTTTAGITTCTTTSNNNNIQLNEQQPQQHVAHRNVVRSAGGVATNNNINDNNLQNNFVEHNTETTAVTTTTTITITTNTEENVAAIAETANKNESEENK